MDDFSIKIDIVLSKNSDFRLQTSEIKHLFWFSDIYIQGVLNSAVSDRGYSFKASFYFEIICLLCVPSFAEANDGLTEKEMIKPNGLLVLLS